MWVLQTYRCWIIFRESNRWICVLPLPLYLGSIGRSILRWANSNKSSLSSCPLLFLALSIYIIIGTAFSSDNIEEKSFSRAAVAGCTFLSVTLNCLVTALISYKLIRLRIQLSRILTIYDPKPTLGVVLILVESALPLSICGIFLGAVTLLFQTTATKSLVISRWVSSCLWYILNVSELPYSKFNAAICDPKLT